MEAIGAVDEANSALGLAAVALRASAHAATSRTIQNDLFDLGADLATPGEDFAPGEMRCGSSRPKPNGSKRGSTR